MRSKLFLAFLLTAAAPALAQSVSPAAAPPGAAACSGCHGPVTAPSAVPSLQSRTPDEIVAAMRAFRTGEREATLMNRIAKGFTDEETQAIAAWVTRQR
jgi:sulfide dehydrogenase cytochrome subunit